MTIFSLGGLQDHNRALIQRLAGTAETLACVICNLGGEPPHIQTLGGRVTLEDMLNAARDEGRTQGLSGRLQTHKILTVPHHGQGPHPGFHVWNPRNGMPRVVQYSLEAAKGEAKRIAELAPDGPVFVMAPVAFAHSHSVTHVQPATFHAVDQDSAPLSLDDEIPF